MKKTRKTKQLIAWDLHSPESLEMFRKAAKEFTDQVIESKTGNGPSGRGRHLYEDWTLGQELPLMEGGTLRT